MSELNTNKLSLEDFKNHYYFNILEYHHSGQERLHMLFRAPILDSEKCETMTINIVGDNSEDERKFYFNQVIIEEKIHEDLWITTNKEIDHFDAKEGYPSITRKLITKKSVFETTFTEFIKEIAEQLIPDYLNNLKLYNNHGGFIEAKPYIEEFKAVSELLIHNLETKTNNPFKQSKKIDDFDFNYLLLNIEDQEKKKMFGTLNENLEQKSPIKTKKI
jgi:hypothetical protein